MKNIVLDYQTHKSEIEINSNSRIIIIGTSGSGKSTLARKIAEKAQLNCIELDHLFWNDNWRESSSEEFRNKVQNSFDKDCGFVIDGNYNKIRDLTWNFCDTIIWLDYPKILVMWRIVKRTIMRAITKKPLWHNNIETLTNAFFFKNSIIYYSWTSYGKLKKLYSNLNENESFSIKRMIIIRKVKYVEKLLAAVNIN